MNHEAIQIIKAEHRSLAAVLNAGKYICAELTSGNALPNFSLLDALLRYIEEFPDVLHHPKEDNYLFARITMRTHQADLVIETLRRQHLEGADLMKNLRRLLDSYLQGIAGSGTKFLESFAAFIQFNFKHMSIEEREIFPVAETCLLKEDWDEIVRVFRDNKDPLFGAEKVAHFRELFHQIVLLSPSPIGLAS